MKKLQWLRIAVAVAVLLLWTALPAGAATVNAEGRNGAIRVSWSGFRANTVTATAGGESCGVSRAIAFSRGACTITGLMNGQTYTVSFTASRWTHLLEGFSCGGDSAITQFAGADNKCHYNVVIPSTTATPTAPPPTTSPPTTTTPDRTRTGNGGGGGVSTPVVVTSTTTSSLPTRFPDVTDHHPVDAINWADKTGLTIGYLDGTFRPDEPLSLEHARLFLERFYRLGYGRTQHDPGYASEIPRPDAERLVADGLTRAQMVELLYAKWQETR